MATNLITGLTLIKILGEAMRKDIFYYFKKSVAFFDIRAKMLPPVVFLIILALYAFYMYLMQIDIQSFDLASVQYFTSDEAVAPVQASLTSMLLGIVIMLVVNLVSFVYLDAAVREVKNEDYTARDCVNSALKHFPGLTGVSILKNIILGVGLFFFIIPGIYLAVLFIFAECAILDKNKHVLDSMRFSRNITKKRRGDIFKIELFCNLIIAIFVILLLSIFASYNLIVFQYIMLFTLSLCTLIEHKLVALLYSDAMATVAYEQNRGEATPAPPGHPLRPEGGSEDDGDSGSDSDPDSGDGSKKSSEDDDIL